ncbi:MAG: nucleotide pyrophosphohydrolase [Candidatus Izemoplasmatales bacterium]|jgi:NTP pyrophosphatase (non-canonical NTP hydrolase)|nr:nucleotide pyrophosphohydrolase [Candidatus Izemoplasmatales bacterium]MDD5602225.1 nucleotide pyrophosphohydrolase [Candidatus Izemoplasmatales bacterium]MDY0373155.1 nucleotide pyrophosphohydrolase [Candidatus Izemoplasmatales bacterium]
MKKLLETIIQYRDERGWKERDTPDSLAKSIIIEAAELLENFQWADTPPDQENIKEELADVLIYALAMVSDLGYDPETIIREKLKKNNIKYPLKK